MTPIRSEPHPHRRTLATRLRACAASSLLTLGCASANDGALDPSFGTGGVVAIDVVPAAQVDLTRVFAAVEDSLGRTLLIGRGATGEAETYAEAYVVVALGEDGTIDASYGAQGTASLPITGSGSLATPLQQVSMDAVLLPDQRVAVCVSIADADAQPAVFLFALTAGGQVDGSFGPGGQPGFLYFGYPRSFFDFPAVPGCGTALSNGALHVSGRTGSGAPGSVAIARLTSTGAYDTNWSGDGIAYVDANPAPLATQDDGKFLLATVESGADDSVAGVVRVRADGTIDDDFGDGGVALADLGSGYDQPLALAVDAQGRILLGGYAFTIPATATCGTCVARITSGGVLDSSFNPTGAASGTPGVARLAELPTTPARIVVTSAQRILVAATAWTGPYPPQGLPPYDQDFLAVRLLDDGSPDPGYGALATPGYARADIDANTVSDDVVSPGVFVDGNGRTVLTGTSAVKVGDDNVLRFAAARLVDGDLFSDGFE